MKILVVGGAGYVGGALTDQLAKSSHQVRVYDSLLYEECYRKPVDFVMGDIRDHDRLKKHLDWADVVVWLAALVGDGACALNPEVTIAVNEKPVQHLAENYDGRIIFMSTCSVYGAQDGEIHEESPVNPLSLYASTKLSAEQALEGKNALSFRLGTLFGVGDLYSRIRLDLVVNTLTVRAYRTGHITIFGGEQFRPLLHVRDVAGAIVQNLESDATGVYNLHRQNVRIIDLAYQIRNHFPDLEIETTPTKFEDSRNYRVSSDRAREELGFAPVHSIDDGIEEVKELISSGRLKHPENPRYTNTGFLSMFNGQMESGRGHA